MIEQLTKALGQIAPIHGVSIGRRNDKSTWRIDFKADATVEQRAAAQAVLNTFDAAKVAHNAEIDEQITDLEEAAGGYVRGLREFMLGNEQRIGMVREMCSALAADDPAKPFATAFLSALPSFSSTKGMQNVKALDDQIRALRAKRLP